MSRCNKSRYMPCEKTDMTNSSLMTPVYANSISRLGLDDPYAKVSGGLCVNNSMNQWQEYMNDYTYAQAQGKSGNYPTYSKPCLSCAQPRVGDYYQASGSKFKWEAAIAITAVILFLFIFFFIYYRK